jgi:hypothetical protein
MSGTTIDILLTAAFLLGMALFGLGMFGIARRWGPRSGNWAQPAAKLRRSGGRMFLGLWGVAILHVVVGLGLWIFAPGGGIAIFLVLLGAGAFYAACAYSWQIAHRAGPRWRAPVT